MVDPEGYVVAQLSGEGHAHGLRVLLDDLVAEHEAKGTLHRGDGPYVAPEPEPTTLRFPAKAVRLPAGTLLVADAGHHQLVEIAADLETVVRRLGTGDPALLDGAGGGGSLQRAQRAVPAAGRPLPPRSAMTWSSPTPSTTRCAGSRSPPAR